jgi:hypothetical protein
VAVACFVVAALGFAYQFALLAFQDSPSFHERFVRDRVVMVFMAMVTTVVGVLWIAVALA